MSTKGADMFWTDEKLTQLRRLAYMGKSFSEAAEILGTTRNAVAGKAHRNGIGFFCSGEKHRVATKAAVQLSWDRASPERRTAASDRARRNFTKRPPAEEPT